MKRKIEKLQEILNVAVDGRKIFGTSFCIRHLDFNWCGSSGNLELNRQFFIASTTKLFITSIIMQWRSQGLISLNDKIEQYLEEDTLKNLHVLGGRDYSRQITIEHLLAHTSGIPDYFQNKDSAGESLEMEIVTGKDQHWSYEEAVSRSKRIQPLFAPGSKGKAHYSDTNFQLLGEIIRKLEGKPLDEVLNQKIIKPLGLAHTYLYTNPADIRPAVLYYKNQTLQIPKAMASFGPDGGIVSTSGDMINFIEAFFSGGLFPKDYIAEMCKWNKTFFPMQSGIGMHRFKLPWIFNPFGSVPDMIGHSGLSGAIAYHAPEKNIFIAGTVNQVAFPDRSFRLAIKLMLETIKTIHR
jgi:CubicO group peptidase (beta-lactamase class C family)